MASVESDLSPEEQRLADILERYYDAQFRLASFVHDAREWVEELVEEDGKMTALMERFRRYEKGEDVEPPEGKDVISVTLTLEEVTAVRTMIERKLQTRAQYLGMVAEMALVNLVAAFEAFLTDLLKAVLTGRPEMLKRSSKQVTYEEVVEASSRDALVSQLAEREVGSWFYKSFRDQAVILVERFGIDLGDADKADLESLVETYARRNLLVHNGGVVNQLYLDLTRSSTAKCGEKLDTDADYWDTKAKEMGLAAEYLHSQAVERFFSS